MGNEDNQTMIYFDLGAATPIDPAVKEAMLRFTDCEFGNPSSMNAYGNEPALALESARALVGRLINAGEGSKIVFTSGATESNNMALKGVAVKNVKKGRHIVTSAIEHLSVLTPLKYLEKQGFEITKLPVDRYGCVCPRELEQAIREDTILISIMHANNEIGTIQPIKELGAIARDAGITFHVDATASSGKLPIDVRKDNIDLLTLSSNDMYGPRGVGALYMAKGVRLEPLIHGGGQEFGLRSGSENIPGIVGMGKAAELAAERMETDSARLRTLGAMLIKGVLETIEYAFLNGHPTNRVPGNANIRFSFIEGEALLLDLDLLGIAASSSSACTSKTLSGSHVLEAIGVPHEEAQSALLVNMGRWHTKEDVNDFLLKLPQAINRLRALSPLAPGKEYSVR